jgi:hypothetical protein
MGSQLYQLQGLCTFMLCLGGLPLHAYTLPQGYFAPRAGDSGSTAIARTDPDIVAWASGVDSIQYGEGVDPSWRVPQRALGPSSADTLDVVPLGRGGSATVTFDSPITDLEGWDFAVFENAFDDEFLELAWVEVSSDGQNFARLPSVSHTPEPIEGHGKLHPALIYGLASKYRIGYATPFDLNELKLAWEQALLAVDGGSTGGMSEAYRQHLIEVMPHVDTQTITHVRVVDIVGDGSARDAAGNVIYDPYPTHQTAGFDFDAVAVFHMLELSPYEQWAQPHGLASGSGGQDADSDGIANYLEFAFSTEPHGASPLPMPQPAEPTDPGAAPSWEMATAGPVDVLISKDFAQWQPASTSWSNGLLHIQAPEPAAPQGTPIWFFRYKVPASVN